MGATGGLSARASAVNSEQRWGTVDAGRWIGTGRRAASGTQTQSI